MMESIMSESTATTSTTIASDTGVDDIFTDRVRPERQELLRLLSINVGRAEEQLRESIAAAEDQPPESIAATGPEIFDVQSLVEIPTELSANDWFSPAEIGAVSVANSGIRLNAYGVSREIEIHSLAAGYRHAKVCDHVNSEITMVLDRNLFQGRGCPMSKFGDGTVGGANFVSAPDINLTNNYDRHGNPLGNTEDAPIFICEVEDKNRSLPALIRHCAALFVNFPNLNAVVGIKCGESVQGHWAALFVVEKPSPGVGVVNNTLLLTSMYDFGPTALTTEIVDHTAKTFKLTLPPSGSTPIPKQHGMGLTTVPIPNWTRLPDGCDADGIPFVHVIPAQLMVQGAYRLIGHGAHSQTHPIPPPFGPGAQLNLNEILRQYGVIL